MAKPVLGGIVALRGFDYQATATLDCLITHFEKHGSAATVRPEGMDDLDLKWTTKDGWSLQRYVQIKKPREDQFFSPTGRAWTVAEIAAELVPGALANLRSNAHEQVWILGDKVEKDVSDLIDAGCLAPRNTPVAYWRVVHSLSRGEAIEAASARAEARTRLMRWRLPTDLPSDAESVLARIVEEFTSFAIGLGLDASVADTYAATVRRIHLDLPDTLDRVSIETLFGSEDEVARRVRARLESHYGLDPAIVEATLFRNLRSFINDIAKQPGRYFDEDEFELELRSVWPMMMPVREPPALDDDHIRRPDLTLPFTTGWSGRAIEATGVSGAGKTMLAAEVSERSRKLNPGRLVIYVEARTETSFRDVLVGFAFHLRRLGFGQLFATAVNRQASTEVVLAEMARALLAVPRETLLLVDMVQGTCSEPFARDLATFVRAGSLGGCRIAVLGQESAFRDLSILDRNQFGVGNIDVRGFNVDEFVALVSRRHREPDYALLHSVFQKVTAGRESGLYAKLAQSLARAPSLEAMRELVSRSPDEILERADRMRFSRISEGARPAAEKIVCFALPFRRSEAEEVFPNDNVGAAITEMHALGLVRETADGGYEMHETVRAGLEGTIGVGKRRSAHRALADHCARRGDVPAEVFHLERAGQLQEARKHARAAFLRGESWQGLAGFVTTNALVTASEVLSVVAKPSQIDGVYLLVDILAKLPDSVDAREMVDILRAQQRRFLEDYQWASALVGACLRFGPERLNELIEFAFGLGGTPDRRETALSTILVAIRRHGCSINAETLELFDRSAENERRLLLPLLLADGRRNALSRAFTFISNERSEKVDRRRSSWSETHVSVRHLNEAIEFLAAIPPVREHEILAFQSPLLGELISIVWRNRQSLRIHCIDVLEAGETEQSIQMAAIRILVLLAEPRLIELCDRIAQDKENPIHGFATLVPTLVPTLVDHARYEATLLDTDLTMDVRMAALAILAGTGADLEVLYRRLQAREASSALELWDFMFLSFAPRNPFAAAIPLLEAQLVSDDVAKADLFVGALVSLGRLPGAEATSMLKRALSHPTRSIRGSAALVLANRRTRTALPDLRAQFRTEADAALSVTLATAIIASGATSVSDLEAGPHQSDALSLWQCILAARTRDVSFAARLVIFASDSEANWQLRRAAIDAAGFLPFEAALSHMLPILRERPVAPIDNHQSLHTQGVLSWFLLNESATLHPRFLSGRDRFATLVTGILEDSREGLIDPRGLSPAREAANWLYDRLETHGWPADRGAPDAVIGELNTPLLHSAILRALRRADRFDLIEVELARAEHVWTATKCLVELSHAQYDITELPNRLRELVARSQVADDPRLEAAIANFAPQVREPARKPTRVSDAPARQVSYVRLGYEEASEILAGERSDPDSENKAAVVLDELTLEQFERLVRLADPANDRDSSGTERYVPGVVLGRNSYSVAQRSITYSGNSGSPGAWIRPALVAANFCDVPIKWHEEILSSRYPDRYVSRMFAALATRGDANVFYRVLYQNPRVLLPYVCSDGVRQQVKDFLDDRMIPFLSMHLTTGTDDILEGLCGLARAIVSPAIDPVLSRLLRRWTGHFEAWRRSGRFSTSHHMWRAFRDLTEHPRFDRIEDWHGLLMPVMQAPIRWHEKQSITRVLERDPRSYIQLECFLFKAEDWESFFEDEIDRLQESVERHFHCVSDEGASPSSERSDR